MRHCEESLLQLYEEANDKGHIKNLLLLKKEEAIERILKLMPFLKSECGEVKHMFLKILPVLFSYISLYDMRITETHQIMEILQVHPTFTNDQPLFQQWSALFSQRKMSKKRFSFKDESCVRGLPDIEINYFREDSLHKCVGYSSVHLLRGFHRWLRLHRLHKYLFFFANLSYEDIMKINKSNIDVLEDTIGIHRITIGAKNKMLREIEALRNRKTCLEGLLLVTYKNCQTIETTVREIKRILRTPICVADPLDENLPNLLVKTMERVFDEIQCTIGMNEDVIPLYGLLISIFKEAWNYPIFQPYQKDLFNYWRQQLSSKINQNSSTKKLPTAQTLGVRQHRSSDDTVESINFDQLTQHEPQEGESLYSYNHMEKVATGIFNFVFQ